MRIMRSRAEPSVALSIVERRQRVRQSSGCCRQQRRRSLAVAGRAARHLTRRSRRRPWCGRSWTRPCAAPTTSSTSRLLPGSSSEDEPPPACRHGGDGAVVDEQVGAGEEAGFVPERKAAVGVGGFVVAMAMRRHCPGSGLAARLAGPSPVCRSCTPVLRWPLPSGSASRPGATCDDDAEEQP